MERLYDVVVVGSGFGGGIAACRLADANQRVVVLERGRRFGRDDFPDRPEQAPQMLWDEKANPGGLFDGCPMADNPAEGVVGDDGRVHGYRAPTCSTARSC